MGFVPNMRVPCTFYVNQHLQQLMFEELEQFVSRGDVGGFLPAVKQLANVAALPGKARPTCEWSSGGVQLLLRPCADPLLAHAGIVKASIALPDVHSGYGFAIGNVAAFDMSDPESIVSPGQPSRGLSDRAASALATHAALTAAFLRRRRLRHQLRRALAAHEPRRV